MVRVRAQLCIIQRNHSSLKKLPKHEFNLFNSKTKCNGGKNDGVSNLIKIN